MFNEDDAAREEFNDEELEAEIKDIADKVLESMIKSGHIDPQVGPDGRFQYTMTPLGLMFDQWIETGLYLARDNKELQEEVMNLSVKLKDTFR